MVDKHICREITVKKCVCNHHLIYLALNRGLDALMIDVILDAV
jgi:hypothetical protein